MYYHLYVLLWLAIPSFNPALFQRIAIAKDAKQASKAFIIASLIVFLLKAIICWVGFLILSIYPGISGNDIFKVIILDYTWVIGFKGLILAGIMAMVMSTVDSYINSSSILLTHDLKESLDIKFIRNELFATRVCSIIIGAISILFAMRDGSFLELFIWASLFYMPIVTVPFMMSVFGFRSSGSSVLAGMFAGFVVAMGWELILKSEMGNVGGLIPGMLANLLVLLSYHYIFNQSGGWVGIKDPSVIEALQEERKKN